MAKSLADSPRTRGSWYRGEICNFTPDRKLSQSREDARKFILKGWVPSKPFLKKDIPILTFGSCFASQIINYLNERGYSLAARRGLAAGAYKQRARSIHFNAGVNHTFALRSVFEHVYHNKTFKEETWHDSDGEIIARKDKFREEALAIFERAKVFILTLGLSEVWYNKETNEVFWRAVPEEKFNPKIHEFKVTTVAENKANIQRVYDLIKENQPEAKVIFTVSPVSLVATFRPVSCITANCVSKSILRAAMDEVYRENNGDNNPDLWYWPSYELVEKFFPDPYRPDGDLRHIKKECVQFVMEEFERAYSLDAKPENTRKRRK